MFNCVTCGKDVLPEWCMINDDLWYAHSGLLEGFMCITCFETILGRQLVPADFSIQPHDVTEHREEFEELYIEEYQDFVKANHLGDYPKVKH